MFEYPKYKKVLFCTDFSECADHAFWYAFGVAKRDEGFFHILHVNDNMASQSYVEGKVEAAYPELAESIRETARKELENELQERYARKIKIESVPFEIVIKEGQPYHEIIRFAREKNVDIIVIGTRGKTAMKHAFLGSVAEMTTRLSAIPVFSIPCGEKNWPDIMY